MYPYLIGNVPQNDRKRTVTQDSTVRFFAAILKPFCANLIRPFLGHSRRWRILAS